MAFLGGIHFTKKKKQQQQNREQEHSSLDSHAKSPFPNCLDGSERDLDGFEISRSHLGTFANQKFNFTEFCDELKLLPKHKGG